MGMGNESRVRLAGAVRGIAIVVGVVVATASLRLARPVLVPLAAGLFVAVLARPLECRLRGALPRSVRALALVVTMLVVTGVVAGFAAALAWSGRAVVDELRARGPQIERQLAQLRPAAARVGVSIPELPAGLSRRPGNAAAPPRRAPAEGASPDSTQLGGRVAGPLVATLGGLVLTLAFAALGLAEADEVRRRIAVAAPGEGGRRALHALDETARAFRRYVWVKSITSALTGACTGALALAFGLPLAWVWAFLAFLLEYVPSVGSVLAIAPPTLMALAEGRGMERAGAVLASFTVMQVVLGNVVDPRIEGRLMAVSPFVVLLSIVFWGWLWGPVGALLAVPLTVAVVIACRHVPGARGVATVLAGDDAPGGP